jgi:hypothetical protein
MARSEGARTTAEVSSSRAARPASEPIHFRECSSRDSEKVRVLAALARKKRTRSPCRASKLQSLWALTRKVVPNRPLKAWVTVSR